MHAFPLNFPRTDDEENPHPELFNRGQASKLYHKNIFFLVGPVKYIFECLDDHPTSVWTAPSALNVLENNQDGRLRNRATDVLSMHSS
ncbi:hypothetical protein COCNU_11G013520 [Cocos nucifera]|uniref:Uncharacterized protein n=1 Tax=Cocos nucifera TaxID=13894 RepID=A0A8K0IQN8_COCNU|nr:hypothetical protein COCNU_11G013520 [Cocos nucifera]